MVGDGPVRIDAFIDFLCPFCRRFEVSAGPALAGPARQRAGRPRLSPDELPGPGIDDALLDAGGRRFGCAADEGRFLEYAHALFADRPPEGGPGLDNAELAAIGQTAGLPAAAFTACWPTGATWTGRRRWPRVPWRWESRRRPPSWSRAPPCARNRGPSRPRSKRRLALAEASRAGYPKTASRSVVPFTSFTRSSRVPGRDAVPQIAADGIHSQRGHATVAVGPRPAPTTSGGR